MSDTIFIEDVATGRIRVHKNVQNTLQKYASYSGKSISKIETKDELAMVITDAIQGGILAEIDNLAEMAQRELEPHKK